MSDRSLESQRTRSVWTIFSGNAVVSVAYIAGITVASLIARDLTDGDTWAGVPSSMGTAGAAVGAAVLTAWSKRVGRRVTFVSGYAIAAVGGFLAALSVVQRAFPLLLLGFLLVGFGRSVSQLGRFAAADMRSEERRGAAISTIVWAGTIGAVIGPRLISPTGEAAVAAGRPELLGPVWFMAIGFGVAALVLWLFLRPDPLTLAVDERQTDEVEATDFRGLLSLNTVRLGVAGLVTSQFVMVLIMTMTPIHLDGNGYDLNDVGWVMTSHTVGMFALAPLTGWLVDRFGARLVLGAGAAMLIGSAIMAAGATQAELPILLPSLFLLGLGWNFGYVASSTELQTGLSLSERLGLQGFADSATWVSGGAGALFSGIIVNATSYPALSYFGAVMSVIPLVALLLWKRQPVPV